MLWVQALFDLELERARSDLRPKLRLMAFARAALALAFGVLFVILGLGALGLLIGLVGGDADGARQAAGRQPRKHPAGRAPARADGAALPLRRRLAVTAALSFMINSSDRFVIGWRPNDAAVGQYVAFDLTSFSIGLLLMIVNLAAYPLVIRALQDDDPDQAQPANRRPTALLAWACRPRSASRCWRGRSPRFCWAPSSRPTRPRSSRSSPWQRLSGTSRLTIWTSPSIWVGIPSPRCA